MQLIQHAMLMLGNPQFTHSCILQRKIEVLLQSSNFQIAADEEQICMEPIKSKHRIINYFGHRGKTIRANWDAAQLL